MPWQPDSVQKINRRGAVWPTGPQMNEARRVPGLSASDGSILLQPHGGGTDIALNQPRPVRISYASGVFTINVSLMAVNSSSLNWLTMKEYTWTFNEPASTAEISICHLPWYHLTTEVGGGAGDQALTDVGEAVWSLQDDTLTPTGTTANWQVSTDLGLAYNDPDTMLADITLYNGGYWDFVWHYWPYWTGYTAGPTPWREPYLPYGPRGHRLLIHYVQPDGKLYCLSKFDEAITLSASFNGSVYVYGNLGEGLTKIKTTTPSATEWGFALLTVQLDADLKPVVFSPVWQSYWYLDMRLATANSGQGVTANQTFTDGAASRTMVIKNGIITSITTP